MNAMTGSRRVAAAPLMRRQTACPSAPGRRSTTTSAGRAACKASAASATLAASSTDQVPSAAPTPDRNAESPEMRIRGSGRIYAKFYQRGSKPARYDFTYRPPPARPSAILHRLPRRQSNRRLCGCASRTVSRELVHPLVAEGSPRGEVVVHAAKQAKVLRGRGAITGPRDGVVELDPQGRPADATGFQRPLAAATVSQPNLAPHRGGNDARSRGGHPSAWFLHDAFPAGVPLQDEIESRLQDSLCGRARIGVRKCRPCRFELFEEPFRDRDVKSRQLS